MSFPRPEKSLVIEKADEDGPRFTVSFGFGAVSSLMPTVVSLFNFYSHGKNPEITNWAIFIPIAFVYALFADLFTAWWEPESKFKAVWIGISFSTIVTTLLQNAPSLK